MKTRFHLIALVLFVVCGCGALPSATPTLPPPKNPSLPETSPTPAPSSTVAPSDTPATFPTWMPTIPPFTSTPRFTATPRPTDTPTSTLPPTAYALSRTNGPYLMYLRTGGKNAAIILADADGRGRKAIPLPESISAPPFYADHFELTANSRWLSLLGNGAWFLEDLRTGKISELGRLSGGSSLPQAAAGKRFSPSGKWMAFLEGNLEDENRCRETRACWLRLVVRNLVEEHTIIAIPLLAANFPEGLFDAMEDLADPDSDHFIQPFGSFYAGIGETVWAPDSRHLAFVGALSGGTSDVYVLDMESLEVTRLTDGPTNAAMLEWTPDSRYLINYGAFQDGCGGGPCGKPFLTPLDGGISIPLADYPCDSYSQVVAWRNPASRVCLDIPGGRLLSYDVLSATLDTLVEKPVSSPVYDPVSASLLFNRADEMKDAFSVSLRMASLTTGALRDIPLEICRELQTRESYSLYATLDEEYPFAVRCADGALLMKPNGDVFPLSDRPAVVSLSPSGAHMLVYDILNRRAIIRTADTILMEAPMMIPAKILPGAESSHPSEGLQRAVRWRPDGAGFFVVTEEGLVYISLYDHSMIRVDQREVVLLDFIPQL